MKAPFYQIDAFTAALFSGNPAGVCLLDAWIDDRALQAIAAENNLSETAFLVPDGPGFELRWFTPVTEVDLCGHATLAAAYVVFNRLDWTGDSVAFRTRFSGPLTVRSAGDLLIMDFPARPPRPCESPAGLVTSLGVEPREVFDSSQNLLAVLSDERQVRELNPFFFGLGQLEYLGIIVTAPGESADFVSRVFCPRLGIPEDPVTGSSHCVLIPFWSKRLGRQKLHARQLSARGGELFCEDAGSRVKIGGRAALYLEGTISY